MNHRNTGAREEPACDKPPQPPPPQPRSPQQDKKEKMPMPLPNNALVLVADGRKMLFFRNEGDENQLDLRTEAHDEREDRYNREIRTDAQGASAHGAGAAGRGIGAQGGGHVSRPAMEETDFHQQE